jgi:hypothetical protein
MKFENFLKRFTRVVNMIKEVFLAAVPSGEITEEFEHIFDSGERPYHAGASFNLSSNDKLNRLNKTIDFVTNEREAKIEISLINNKGKIFGVSIFTCPAGEKSVKELALSIADLFPEKTLRELKKEREEDFANLLLTLKNECGRKSGKRIRRRF